MRICDHQDCEGGVSAKGLCAYHYRKQWASRRAAPDPSRVAGRFWSKVAKTGTCWLWTASQYRDGYGIFYDGITSVRAHRFAYEQTRGPIPEGLVIDHLCRVRHCVNPDHMEPVTNKVNVLRGESQIADLARRSHCVNNHEFTVENTYRPPHGYGRMCRTCRRETYQRNRQRKAKSA